MNVHRASAEKRCHEMADAFEAEATRTRRAIEELDTAVNTLQQALVAECFYSFSTSPTEARARIKETSERTSELLRTMEVRTSSIKKKSGSCWLKSYSIEAQIETMSLHHEHALYC